jgi:hypothetical protein
MHQRGTALKTVVPYNGAAESRRRGLGNRLRLGRHGNGKSAGYDDKMENEQTQLKGYSKATRWSSCIATRPCDRILWNDLNGDLVRLQESHSLQLNSWWPRTWHMRWSEQKAPWRNVEYR